MDDLLLSSAPGDKVPGQEAGTSQESLPRVGFKKKSIFEHLVSWVRILVVIACVFGGAYGVIKVTKHLDANAQRVRGKDMLKTDILGPQRRQEDRRQNTLDSESLFP